MKLPLGDKAMQRSVLTGMLAVLSVASLRPATAWACPFCNSSTAEQVRAGIFNSDFRLIIGKAGSNDSQPVQAGER